MKYAILHKISGQLIDLCDSIEQANWFINQPEKFELVDITHSSKIEVEYTELGGPNGYGHQEPSFITFGGLLTCIRRLYTWMQSEARFWGPDPRDIRDYFRHCRLYINGEDKSEWLFKQINNLKLNQIYG
jgi:hypothetical protein